MSNKKHHGKQSHIKKKQQSKKQDYTTVIIFSAIMLVAAIAFGIYFFGSASNDDFRLDTEKNYFADIVIKDYGTITVQLDPASAPITSANFVKLAQDGFYNGLTFHRIMEGFMMQGGAPKNQKDDADNIIGEFAANGYNNPIKHERGVISMARAKDNNSANSQFFIMQETKTHLDGQYAAFGKVIKGIEIVDAVCKAAKPVDSNGTIKAADQPVITSITVRTEE